MLEFEQLFKASEMTSLVSKPESSSRDTKGSNNTGEAFKAILEDSVGSGTAAKTGSISPQFIIQQEVKGHRNLSGGSALILGGSQPTDESITAFAALQGIDPSVMAIIMGESWIPHVELEGDFVGSYQDRPMLGEVTGHTLNALGKRVESFAKEGVDESKALNITVPQMISAERIQKLDLVNPDSVDSKISIGDAQHMAPFAGMQKLDLVNLDAGDAGDVGDAGDGETIKISITDVQEEVPVAGIQKLDLVNLDIGDGRTKKTNTLDLPVKTILKEGSLDDKAIFYSRQNTTIEPFGKVAAKNAITVQQMTPDTGIQKLDVIPLGSGLSQTKNLSNKAIFNGTQTKIVEQSIEVVSKNTTTVQDGVPGFGMQKLESIDLGDDAERILMLSNSRGAGTANINLISNQMPDLRADLTAKSMVETQSGGGQDQLIRRQDQYLAVSRRLAEALGERLTAQISKGAWRVEMDLHPKSLGRIEVHLEMKNGTFEAYFNPSQNVTRELLQDSFEKLKDNLSEHGIDSAYLGLGSGKKHHSDGNPTGDTLAEEADSETESDTSTISDNANKGHLSIDGLDIQV